MLAYLHRRQCMLGSRENSLVACCTIFHKRLDSLLCYPWVLHPNQIQAVDDRCFWLDEHVQLKHQAHPMYRSVKIEF